MRVSIFGLGYVGSVTAACLARAGHEVYGVDVNADKTAMINAGRSPVIERGLTELIGEMVAAGRLRATVAADYAVRHSDLAMICVGTPSGRNGQLDTSAIERVLESIYRALEHRTEPFTIVLRSTVLPGTTEALVGRALRATLPEQSSDRIAIAVNPEFMREGTAIADFGRPAMTLAGCASESTAEQLRTLYASVDAPFVQTSIRAAEMTKYVSNAFHALKICFANEIADLCESLDVDVQEVSRLFLSDRKLNVSDAYLRPGFAFGGSCLPKDLRALMYAARRSDIHVPLLTSIAASNDQQIQRVIELVLHSGSKRIGVAGLAFKAGTDDLRESPMVKLVETLIGKGCAVRIFDPHVALSRLVGANREYIQREIPHIASLMREDIETLLNECDVIVVGSAGKEYLAGIMASQREHTIIDLTRTSAMRIAGMPLSEVAV